MYYNARRQVAIFELISGKSDSELCPGDDTARWLNATNYELQPIISKCDTPLQLNAAQ